MTVSVKWPWSSDYFTTRKYRLLAAVHSSSCSTPPPARTVCPCHSCPNPHLTSRSIDPRILQLCFCYKAFEPLAGTKKDAKRTTSAVAAMLTSSQRYVATRPPLGDRRIQSSRPACHDASGTNTVSSCRQNAAVHYLDVHPSRPSDIHDTRSVWSGLTLINALGRRRVHPGTGGSFCVASWCTLNFLESASMIASTQGHDCTVRRQLSRWQLARYNCGFSRRNRSGAQVHRGKQPTALMH